MHEQKTTTYEVSLSLSREKMLRVYRDSANTVLFRSRCGTVLQLAAKHLQPFLGHNGVHGNFRLTLSVDNRLTSIERID